MQFTITHLLFSRREHAGSLIWAQPCTVSVLTWSRNGLVFSASNICKQLKSWVYDILCKFSILYFLVGGKRSLSWFSVNWDQRSYYQYCKLLSPNDALLQYSFDLYVLNSLTWASLFRRWVSSSTTRRDVGGIKRTIKYWTSAHLFMHRINFNLIITAN